MQTHWTQWSSCECSRGSANDLALASDGVVQRFFLFLLYRQSQLAKMTSELCDSGADEQREKEAPATSKSSSLSPLSVATSLELPGPWSSPVSPVTAPTERRTVNLLNGFVLGLI